jgi:hypothetical protein
MRQQRRCLPIGRRGLRREMLLSRCLMSCWDGICLRCSLLSSDNHHGPPRRSRRAATRRHGRRIRLRPSSVVERHFARECAADRIHSAGGARQATSTFRQPPLELRRQLNVVGRPPGGVRLQGVGQRSEGAPWSLRADFLEGLLGRQGWQLWECEAIRIRRSKGCCISGLNWVPHGEPSRAAP